MTHDIQKQVLEILMDGLPEQHRPLARKTLLAASDPQVTGVPTMYALPYIRCLLEHVVPYDDPEGFVHRALSFLRENEHEVDWCNTLGADHEAETMSALATKYVGILKNSDKRNGVHDHG